ncbi:MAG TPA: beta-galactosidase, partial [Sphingobacteriaceae bacterium]
RIPRADWEESILKMKSVGIQIIATYIFWIQTEEEEGKFNWQGDNNLREFIKLCNKHDVYVWLRIGPWCHGEIRNGGFPDWLLKKGIGLRKNDPEYLKYVQKLFAEIARQADGYYYKQGGNIIGVQLENELAYKTLDKLDHMLTLKQIAIKEGMDVPYYSSFAPSAPDQRDFLTPIGGYPDSPWSSSTKKLVKNVFFFNPLENDKEIGADLFGQIDTRVYGKVPPLSAELGGGMQVTYHRRTKVIWEDVLSIAYTRLGSGLNGLGYYMFHGGINPIGKFSTLQESRATGYPNDVPVINYDFQAPIGAMNDLKPSYYEYKLLHAFVNDFGEQLASMPAFFPQHRVKSARSYDTVRIAARSYNNSGYLFLSNYQRYSDLKPVENFQVSLKYKDALLKIPENPVSFPANAMMIWPFNQAIHDTKLIYATAQLMYKLSGTKDTYVFYGNENAEFVFDDLTLKSIDGNNALFNIQTKNGRRYVTVKQPGRTAILHIESKSGKTYDIIILNKKDTIQSWKHTVNGTDHLILTDADLFVNGTNMVFQQYNKPTFQVMSYPELELQVSGAWTMKTIRDNGLASYTISTKKWSEKPGYQEEKDQFPDHFYLEEEMIQRIKTSYPEPLKNAVKIWSSPSASKTWFRKDFVAGATKDQSVYFAFTADDYANVYCNGIRLDGFTSNTLVSVYNLSKYLKPGSNNLNIEVINNHADGGLHGTIFIAEADRVEAIPTDTSWKVSAVHQKGWYNTNHNNTSWTKASVARPAKKQPVWDNPQPGNLYDQTQRYYPGQKRYSLQLPQRSPEDVKDVYIDLSYSGDMAAIYSDKQLVYDDFNYGGSLKFRVNTLKLMNKDKVDVQLFPVKKTHDVFVEDEFKAGFNNGSKPKIDQVEFIPLYEAVITIKQD